MVHYDVLIVGAGLTGATIAEHYKRAGKKVLVIDKREHLGGNCYDEVDAETGIRVSKYGAHLFHTDDEEVWSYVNQFGSWARWDHKVVAEVDGVHVPVPVNINTVNKLFNLNLVDEADMVKYLLEKQGKVSPVHNSEEVAVNRVGN